MLALVRSLGSRHGPLTVLAGAADPVIARSRHIRAYHVFNPEAPDDLLLRALERLARERGLDLLLPNDDGAMLFVSRHRAALAEIFNLPAVATPATLALATDKERLAGLLAREGLPHPRTLQAADPDTAAAEAAGRLAFPVAVKAPNLAFGQGLFRCTSPDEVRRAAAELAARGQRFFVQEWIEGPDVDCSFYAVDGKLLLATTQRGLVAGRAGLPPTEILIREEPALLATIRRLVAALGWSGVAHVDTVHDARDGQFKILELNGRFWASLLASTAAGVNFPGLIVRHARGETSAAPTARTLHFFAASVGLKRVAGLGHGRRLRLGETNVPFFLRDPLPELYANVVARAARWGARRRPAPAA